jgi:hypothetical protein
LIAQILKFKKKDLKKIHFKMKSNLSHLKAKDKELAIDLSGKPNKLNQKRKPQMSKPPMKKLLS